MNVTSKNEPESVLFQSGRDSPVHEVLADETGEFC
jgi:hypothetical protein